MKLSASLIVKNESAHLRDCLDSIRGVDELVIVDTGSTDNTVDIAREYTDKVYHGDEYKWRDDFAFSRNQASKLCTGDWVLSIDADEVLEKGGIEKVRKAIDTDKDMLYVQMCTMKTKEKSHKLIRLYRRERCWWEARIHNYVTGRGARGHADINIYFGYSEAHKKDPDRALRIAKLVCDENPEAARERFYLAREYWYRNEYREAIRQYNIYLRHSTFKAEIAEAYLTIARCHWHLHEGERARENCLMAIYYNPDFKDALLLMAEMHYEPNKSKWLEFAGLAKNRDVLFT